jgi:hypothetical protein
MFGEEFKLWGSLCSFLQSPFASSLTTVGINAFYVRNYWSDFDQIWCWRINTKDCEVNRTFGPYRLK